MTIENKCIIFDNLIFIDPFPTMARKDARNATRFYSRLPSLRAQKRRNNAD
ncbi:MAG: hypothetical protein ACYC09_13710 [Bacteroidota bacterium]